MPRATQPGKVPAAMKRALAKLKAACDALPPNAETPVSDPIFGSSPRPIAPTISSDLPPNMAAAFANLQAALDGPPCLDGQWPFDNPPGVQAAIDSSKAHRGGRPSEVQPNQVVRLVRFIKLGYSVTESATKAGLKRSTARYILSGWPKIAHHPAVLAAGVNLPDPSSQSERRKPRQNPGKAPRSASNQKDKGQAGSAPPAASSPSIPEPPAEGVPNLAGQAQKGRP